MDKKWRSELDNVINSNLDELIRETKEYDFAIKKSRDKSKAQLWVALAIINKKLNNFNIQKNRTNSKLEKEEIDDILNKLESY